MEVNINLIFNFLIAIFTYNIIIKSIGASLLKAILKTETGEKEAQKIRKSFKERLEDKINEENK